MSKYLYENYIGEEEFLFLRCANADKACAIPLANYLAEQGVKIFFDIQGNDTAVSAQKLAAALEKSSATIFFISGKACGQLEFRNSINYAAEIKKRIICISKENTKPSQGLEVQLENAEKIFFKGAEIDSQEMYDTLKAKEIITQAILGADPRIKPPSAKKKRMLTIVIILVVATFSYLAWTTAVSRVRYYKSAEWLLRDSNGKDYVSLQGAGEDGLRALRGMTIKELDMRKGDITDMEGIEDIHVSLLDLGDCSNIKNMDAIAKSKDLIRVRIPQDMVKYLEGMPQTGIEFELTE